MATTPIKRTALLLLCALNSLVAPPENDKPGLIAAPAPPVVARRRKAADNDGKGNGGEEVAIEMGEHKKGEESDSEITCSICMDSPPERRANAKGENPQPRALAHTLAVAPEDTEPGRSTEERTSLLGGAESGGRANHAPATGNICSAIATAENMTDAIVQLACSHRFHADCIKTWIGRSPRRECATCPACRRVIDLSAIKDASTKSAVALYDQQSTDPIAMTDGERDRALAEERRRNRCKVDCILIGLVGWWHFFMFWGWD
jgi:hypothetical protein